MSGLDVHAIVAATPIAAVVHVDRCESTMTLARSLASTEPLPLLVVADEQTAGRGRPGKAWASAGGDLLMTLVLPDVAVDALAIRIGLSLCQTLAGDVPSIGLKWPNDVVVDGPPLRKLAGVLCETDAWTLHVGVGQNGSRDDEHRVGFAELTGRALDRTDLLRRWLPRLLATLAEPDIAGEVARFDCLRGHPVQNDVTGFGIGKGIDRSGALLVRTADGDTVAVTRGSVRRLR